MERTDRTNENRIPHLLQAWFGLNAADALLTGISLPLGALEANPLLASIAGSYGLDQMLFMKVLLAVALGGALWLRGKASTLRLMNWIMVGIVFYNAMIITYAL